MSSTPSSKRSSAVDHSLLSLALVTGVLGDWIKDSVGQDDFHCGEDTPVTTSAESSLSMLLLTTEDGKAWVDGRPFDMDHACDFALELAVLETMAVNVSNDG